MKEFGTNKLIGNRRVVTMRYTDTELFSRVDKFLKSKGYKVDTDYTVSKYKGVKGRPTIRIEAIIYTLDILLMMSITKRRQAELALQKAEQLELNFK